MLKLYIYIPLSNNKNAALKSFISSSVKFSFIFKKFKDFENIICVKIKAKAGFNYVFFN